MSLTQVTKPTLQFPFNGSNVDIITNLSPSSTTGTPTYQVGKYGQAVSFTNPTSGDPTSNIYYATIPTLDSTSGFTLSFWFNSTNSSFYYAAVPVALTGAFYYFINSDGKLYPVPAPSGGPATPATLLNTWYNIAGVFTNGLLTTYLNGVQSNTHAIGSISANRLSVGSSGADYPFIGLIQDLRIYNTPLGAIQVQALYANGGSPSVPASTTMMVSGYPPFFAGYTYVSFQQLPSSFTLTQTLTGNVVTYNTSLNPFGYGPAVVDGNYPALPALTLTPQIPASFVITTYGPFPAYWYALNSSQGYFSHRNTNVWCQVSYSQVVDFAWAFYLQNGTTNQIKIYNGYFGQCVQSGLFYPGRLAIGGNFTSASVYTISTPINLNAPLSGLSGTPLLSQLSVAPVGAFSLRAVGGTTAKAVQVRRASDNATQDFYADRLGNLLTAPVTGTDLATWLGGATGYVATWYDQSGQGNHMSCSSFGIQPKIDLVNNFIDLKPSAYFDVSAGTTGPVPFQSSKNYTVVFRHGQFFGSGLFAATQNAAGPYGNLTNNFKKGSGLNYTQYWYGNDVQNKGTLATGNRVSYKWDGTNRSLYVNGVLVDVSPSSGWAQTSSAIQMIGKTSFDGAMNGELYGAFMFTTALSDTDRTLLENFL